jgi:hypothetical protein
LVHRNAGSPAAVSARSRSSARTTVTAETDDGTNRTAGIAPPQGRKITRGLAGWRDGWEGNKRFLVGVKAP